jgi:hypothetical protein
MEAYWCRECETPTAAPQSQLGQLVCPECLSPDLAKLVLAPAEPPTELPINRAEAEMIVALAAALPEGDLQTVFHDGVLMQLEDHPAMKTLAAKCKELLTEPEHA